MMSREKQNSKSSYSTSANKVRMVDSAAYGVVSL